MPAPEPAVVGWDVGGAHLKACLMERGRVLDVAQWACPLWQGLAHLDAALAEAGRRWPALALARHAVTMTGEMADLFANRQEGVQRIADTLERALAGPLHFYAGDRGWCTRAHAGGRWEDIASANWRATARHVAQWAEGRRDAGVLVDIGSTTTDLILYGGGRVQSASLNDGQRLASGELVYQGVVRTPLCALAPRILLRGTLVNVMNELFATTADVFRLTGELDPAHDLHGAADGGCKDEAGTCRRLARMVGLDARDARPENWRALAHAWRAAQVAEIGGQLRRVLAACDPGAGFGVTGAGCGAFLVPDVLAAAGLPSGTPVSDYGRDVACIAASAPAAVAAWARVCAPAVAVAALLDGEPR
jgi:probable H4MPT-linked C1 transfer pathway protein